MDELESEVRQILLAANPGKGADPTFLFGLQIFARLSGPLRDSLVAAHGSVGKGAGSHYTPLHRISKAAENVGAEIRFVDVQGVTVNGAEPGNNVTAIYRLAG